MARRLQIPLAVAASVVVAEAAVLLLWPRTGVLNPAEVRPQEYFTASELARGRDFRSGQNLLYLARLLVELAVLAVIVWRPPQRLLHARRPLLAAFVAGAAISVLVAVVALPIGAWSRSRAIDVGLVTQSWGGWAFDLVRSWAIDGVLFGLGTLFAVLLVRRFPRRWWIPASGIVVAFAIALTYASPIVLDPVFNEFRPVTGQTRADVLDLARKAGVDVGQVQVMDASKRTTAANAYVAGLGHTKRVVLYDNLLEHFTRDEVRLVVAHELGHVHYTDVPKGLLWVAIVAPFGMFAAALVVRRLQPDGVGPHAAVPALVLTLTVLVLVITTISNQLSRQVEARADSYSLQLTGEVEPFIGFERRLAVRNVSDPDPPAWRTVLFATHPPTIERIGLGVAYRRSAGR